MNTSSKALNDNPPRSIKWGIVTLLGSVLFLSWIFWSSSRAFDREQWDKSDGSTTVRHEMADRFIAEKSLVGMTREEIVALLGQPEPVLLFKEWDLVYQLGIERGFISIDDEWLVIRLNNDGKVIDYRIVTD